MIKKKKLFVWDFHGVLEKGNDHGVTEITNAVLEKFGHSRRMSQMESEFLAGRRWHEYFVHLVPETTHEERIEMQQACYETSLKHPEIISKHVKLNDHAEEVLHTISESPHTQIVISNSHQKTIELFIQMLGITRFFASTHYYGVDSHTQQKITKKDCLENYLQFSEKPASIVAIGDSPGDVALAGCHPKGVSYLYTHPGRVHREAECHYRIQDLREVLKEV